MPYLYNRSAHLAPGRNVDALSWAMTMTEKVNAVGGPAVGLWSPVLSPEVGTLTWSAVVDDVGEMTALDEKLAGDDGFLALAEEGSQFLGPEGVEDGLVRLVHIDPDGADTAQYASVTASTLAPGHAADGMALGVEMATRIKAITGRPTAFGASVTGPFGQVGWFILSDSIDQVQHVTESLAADADWMALVDKKAASTYVLSGSTRMITRKLA